jgi:hypothetical protein
MRRTADPFPGGSIPSLGWKFSMVTLRKSARHDEPQSLDSIGPARQSQRKGQLGPGLLFRNLRSSLPSGDPQMGNSVTMFLWQWMRAESLLTPISSHYRLTCPRLKTMGPLATCWEPPCPTSVFPRHTVV